MKCFNCGENLPDDSLFCISCGAKQEIAPSPIIQQNDDEKTQIVNENGQGVYYPDQLGQNNGSTNQIFVQPEPVQPPVYIVQQSKNKTGLIFGILAAVLAVALAVVLCVVFLQDKEDSNKNEETTTSAEETTKEESTKEEPTKEEHTKEEPVTEENLWAVDAECIETFEKYGIKDINYNENSNVKIFISKRPLGKYEELGGDYAITENIVIYDDFGIVNDIFEFDYILISQEFYEELRQGYAEDYYEYFGINYLTKNDVEADLELCDGCVIRGLAFEELGNYPADDTYNYYNELFFGFDSENYVTIDIVEEYFLSNDFVEYR